MIRPLRGPFRFDSAHHLYTVGETPVPGIHSVLRFGGLEPDLAFLDPIYRQRGKAVHLATLMHDLGAPCTLYEAWQPFMDAYLKFLSEIRCRWTKLEHPKVHRRLGYATIIDRVGTVNRWPTVFEIKTGYPAEFHGPQLAGADLLVSGRVRIGLRKRLAVYLQKDGTYRLKEYTDPADYSRFLGAVEEYWEDEEECDWSDEGWEE